MAEQQGRNVAALALVLLVFAFWNGARGDIGVPNNPPIAGPQGPSGTPGAQIWQTVGVPGAGIGADGDIAVNTLTANVYQKTGGAWSGPTMNLQGPQGSPGANGTNGTNGAPGGFTAYGQPAARSFSLATAYQCTVNTAPCILTFTVTSTASFSLLSGVTNTADVVIGTTSGVATSGGVAVGKYSNSITATLAIGINAATVANTTYTLNMPAGAFMAIRQTGGTVTIVNSSVEQTVS